MKHFMIRIFAAGAFVGLVFSAAAVERVPTAVVRALGTVRGKQVSTGLVFIDGKYLKAPYRVTRAGNQILVNDRPVTRQLVSWERFLETQPASKLKTVEVEEKGEAKPAAPAEDGKDPAAPADGGNAASAAADGSARVRAVIAETRLAASADDLDDFNPNSSGKMKLSDIPEDTEEDKARQKRAEEEKKAAAKEKEEEEKEEAEEKSDSGASGESDEEVDPASPEGEAAAKKAAAAAAAKKPAVEKKTHKAVELDGAFEMNFRAQKLLKPIDSYRTMLEQTLRRGGYLFFGTGAKPYLHGRTSDAAATKELLKKLPELMGRAEDSEGFCDSVRSAGLMSYVTYQIAQDLFRHKATSVYLKQRRREIAEDEKLKNLTR